MAQEIATPHAHLSWIRSPLDELLEAASTTLQSAAEDEADRESLDEAQSALQRAGATLKLLDLPGAAATAYEMRDTVEQMIDQSLPAGTNRTDIIDRLLGGTVILHDYLDHLESGSSDQSVALLPLLNDLRAIRGARLISEGRYFLPDLERPQPELDLPAPPGQTPALGDVHRHWQAALRDWLRDKDTDAALESLADAARMLRATAAGEPEQRLWLFAQAVLSALRNGAVEDNISLRRCLARLDLFIGRRLHGNEPEDPDQLSRSLLFLVAVSHADTGPAGSLIEHYELENTLKAGAWEQARGSTRGRNTELMNDVATAAADELLSVKQGLNDQIDEPDPETLGSMADTLKGLAHSLEMLSMEQPVRAVREQAERLAELKSDPGRIDEDILLDIAEQLVSVEMELKSSGQPTASQPAAGPSDARERELQQAQSELYAQVVRGLDQAQQELDRMVRGESEGGLDGVLKRLQLAGGALRLVERERAAAALDGARQYLQGISTPLDQRSNEAEMSEFADVLATIEQYVIALRDRQLADEQRIARAAERATALAAGETVAPAAEPEQPEDGEPRTAEFESAEPDAGGDDIDLGAWDTTAPDLEPATDSGAEAPGTEAPEAAASEASAHGEPEGAGEAGESEPAPDAGEAEDIDLHEVLTGEIDDIIATLRAQLPGWSQDPEDRELLGSIRRCFHTLKGSARTVGATAVGEFGWRLENLLNTALEGQREPATTVGAVAEAVQVLPSVRDGISGGDLETLPDNAQSVLTGIDELEAGESEVEPSTGGDAEPYASVDFDGDSGSEADTGSVAGGAEPEAGMPWAESPADYDAAQDTAQDTTGPASGPDWLELDAEAEPESESGEAQAPSSADADHEQPRSAPELPDDPFGSSFAAADGPSTDWWRDEAPVSAPAGGAETTDAPEPGDNRFDAAPADEPGAVSDDDTGADAIGAPAEEAGDETDTDAASVAGGEPESGDQQALAVSAADDKLLMLITNELAEHVEVVDEYLQRADDRGWAEIPDARLLRAVHTSASTTSLSPIGGEPEALRAVEHYLQQLRDAEEPPPRAGLDLLRQAGELIRARIGAHKPGGDPYRPELDEALRERARELLARPAESEQAQPDAPVATGEQAQTDAQPEPAGPTATPFDTTTRGAVVPVDYAAMDPDVLDVFLDESGEVLTQIDAAMDEWSEHQSTEAAHSLRRGLHTLKGSARMTGLTTIGDLSHQLESLMDSLVGGEADEEQVETLQHGCDQLHSMVEAANARQPLPAPEIPSWQPSRRMPADEPETTTEAEAGAETEGPAEGPQAPAAEAAVQPAPETPAQPSDLPSSSLPRERLRVDSELIDRLSNAAGEVSIFRSRLEQQINEMNNHITEVARTITRLREQLRQMDMETEAQIISRHQHDETLDPQFDPLELDRYSKIQQLSRALTESVSDLTNLQEMLDNSAKQSETILLQQSRINTDLQEGLLETRMVPFNSLAPRLRQVVRGAAGEVGVQARLEINSSGVEGQLDRNVLDRVTAPIEHILRNSVVHGIESPEQRSESGKPEQGRISIDVTRDATDLVMEIQDDGAGIDPQALRERARAVGLVQPGNEPDDRTVLQYIFHSGLSTAEDVTELAGRGVGMDVVSNNVRQLGGSVAVESEVGRGTRMTIRIPLTLAVMQAILVQAGERVFAIPLSAVGGVTKISAAECRERLASENPSLEYGGSQYALMDLARLLDIDHQLPESGTVSLLMVEAGGARAALLVTALLQHDEFVVKPVGPQISSVPGVLAGTVTGDGRVVVILDVGPLLRGQQITTPAIETEAAETAAPVETEGERRKPVVLVVDDSITIRKVTARVLEQSGMEALTAKDGLDALEVMQQRRPDAILLDIEMPRMDGYELATHVRNDEQLKDIPIMIISSRTGEKHRERAREYDINDYLGKPYQEEDLLHRLRVLLGREQPSSEA